MTGPWRSGPDIVEVLYHRGNVLQALRRPAEALASYDKALTIKPDHVAALNNSRQHAAGASGVPWKRLASYDRALAIQPAHAQSIYNRGIVPRELQRPAEALASFDRVLSIKPDHVDALNNRGVVLRVLNRPLEALASYDRALSIKPGYVDVLNNRASAARLEASGRGTGDHHHALATSRITPTPCNRGIALRDLKRPAESLASFEAALAIAPDHRYAFAGMAGAALAICDWARTAVIAGELKAGGAAPFVIPPFTLLGYGSDPSVQLECARWSIESEIWWPSRSRHGRRRPGQTTSSGSLTFRRIFGGIRWPP